MGSWDTAGHLPLYAQWREPPLSRRGSHPASLWLLAPRKFSAQKSPPACQLEQLVSFFVGHSLGRGEEAETGEEEGVQSRKRARKGVALFQKRAELASLGISLHRPVVLRAQPGML